MNPLLLIGAVLAGIGTLAAAGAQNKATNLQQKRDEREVARSRRQAIREKQILKAQALASAEGLGAGGSSAVAGGIGALDSQLGERLGHSTSQSGLSREITKQLGKAQTAAGIASIGSSIFNLGASGYNPFAKKE